MGGNFLGYEFREGVDFFDSRKYQPVFRKTASNNIFIMKSQNIKMDGGREFRGY